jgi:hypothetical protein
MRKGMYLVCPICQKEFYVWAGSVNKRKYCSRKCHERAHSSKNYVSKDEFQLIHNNFMQGNRKIFLK